MKVHAITRIRIGGVALLMAMAAGCGGSGGSGGLPPAAPAPAPAAAPAPVMFGAFPSAVAVLGQEGFDETAPDGTPGTLSFPTGEPAIAADGTLFVADLVTGTLKVFGRYDQQGPFTDFPGLTAPRSVSIQSGRLVVVDGDTVRIFESAAPGAAQIATAGGTAVCSAAGLRGPGSAHLTPAGRLVVADSANNRVLIWNQVTSGALGDADVVIGQETMTDCAVNRGGSPTDSTLRGPRSVWSDGNRLIVADTGNHRVLVWDSLPTTSSAAATTVIGQAGFADAQPNAGGGLVPSSMSLDSPVAIDVSEAGQLAVSDEQNNRVLIWDRLPAAGAHGAPANQVIGQVGFTEGESVDTSIRTLSEPEGVRFHGTDLVVVDTENSRVLVWRGTVPPPPPPAPVPAPATPALPLPTHPGGGLEPPGPGNGAY